MKLFHRFGAALLALVLAFSVPLSTFALAAETEAPTIQISSAAQLLNLANSCALDSFSVGRVVTLTADIDLTGCEFAGIPTFGGTFLGGGHTVSGVLMAADGSDQGFFRYLQKTASVQNLIVIGAIAPGGTQGSVGGIAGSNSGVISGCRFQGSVVGGSVVGGIAGMNTVSGTITDCSSTGTVRGKHFVGGIVGQNDGVTASCANYSSINTTAEDDQIDVSAITLADITGTENVAAITDAGGIAGTSSGVVRACINSGAVGYSRVGYNNGGIAGSGTGYFEGCINYGRIYGRKEVGGIVGQLEPSSQLRFTEDTLHRLARELSTLQTLVARACTDAGNSASQMSNQLSALQTQVTTANEATKELIHQMENGMFKVGATQVTTDLSGLNGLLGGLSTSETGLPDLSLPGTGGGAAGGSGTDAAGGGTGTDGTGTDGTGTDPTGTGGTGTDDAGTDPTGTDPAGTDTTGVDGISDDSAGGTGGTDTPDGGDTPFAPAAAVFVQSPAFVTAAAEPSAPARRIRQAGNAGQTPTDDLILLADESGSGATADTAPDSASTADTATPELPGSITFDIPTVSLNNQDNITASRNSLSGSISDISGSVSALSGQGSSATSALAADLNAITAQVDVIGGVLSDFANSSDEDRVRDVSDSDTESDTEGKVVNCANKGFVQGDLNVGGIVGAMAMENDLDPEDDVDILGQTSLNANYKLRAVVRDCTNSGTVSAKKQDAGGIVGRMELGAVRDCLNLGTLDAIDADNIGGVVGESKAIVRSSSAKCTLSGHNKVGGIAGIAQTLTDCRAMIHLLAGNECVGAIAGSLNDDSGTLKLLNSDDDSPEVRDNYFVAGDLQGVDGVSYTGRAAPLFYDHFVQLENLPEAFKSLTVTFVADGSVVETQSYQYGDKLSPELPEPPQKAGYNASWPEFEGEYVLFDQTVEAVYTSVEGVIESEQKRGEQAILLVQGNYSAEDVPVLTPAEDSPVLSGGHLLESWSVTLPKEHTAAAGGETAEQTDSSPAGHTVRYLVPQGSDAAKIDIWVKIGGSWQKADTTADGSYAVFSAPAENPLLFCAVQPAPSLLPLALFAAGMILLLGVITHFAAKHRRKKRAAQAGAKTPAEQAAGAAATAAAPDSHENNFRSQGGGQEDKT